MESVEIRSGPADAIASGTVIAFAGNPVEIVFGPPEERLRLILAFHDQQGEAEPRVEANIADQTTLALTLFNFNNPLGAGTAQPMPAGSLNGRRLYIHLRVYELRDSDKTVHYSIYLGEEVGE